MDDFSRAIILEMLTLMDEALKVTPNYPLDEDITSLRQRIAKLKSEIPKPIQRPDR